LGQPLTLGSPTPMHIVYKKGAGSLRGSIEGGTAATVILVPVVNPNTEVIRSMELAAGAPFEFSNLRPGEYMAVAFDRVDPAKLTRPDYLPGIITLAKRIKIEESAQTTLDLPVNRW